MRTRLGWLRHILLLGCCSAFVGCITTSFTPYQRRMHPNPLSESADIEGVMVERPVVIESTAKGSAYMAGILAGLWKKEDIIKNRKIDRTFEPGLDRQTRENLYAGWKKAVVTLREGQRLDIFEGV